MDNQEIYDVIEEMIQEGFSEEEAQFLAADRFFGQIAYDESKNFVMQ